MRLLKFMLTIALVASASLAVAADAPRKAKTIDELAGMFDSTGCKECHPEIYAQWEKSHHARPFMGVAGGMMLTPVVTASAFKVEKPEQATLKTFPCFKCHAPHVARWAEDGVAKEIAAATPGRAAGADTGVGAQGRVQRWRVVAGPVST